MKINCFTLKKQQQNITIQVLSKNKLFFAAGLQIAVANELELKHIFFLSLPLVKMNIISPFRHTKMGIDRQQIAMTAMCCLKITVNASKIFIQLFVVICTHYHCKLLRCTPGKGTLEHSFT